MPTSPPKACSKPGCGNTTHERYCEQHKQAAAKQAYAARNGSTKYYKSSNWQRLRMQRLMANPFCMAILADGRPCNAMTRLEVDHIVPRESGGKDIFENTQTLCKSCHSRKTLSENAQ